MKVTTKGRYGLRAMIDVAVNSNGDYVSLKNISERQGISEHYLEQLAASLKKSGLLKSNRGSQGGYILGRPPNEISVGDVLRSLEGELAPAECVTSNPQTQCDIEQDCVTKTVWKKMADALNNAVDSIFLEELADEQRKLYEY